MGAALPAPAPFLVIFFYQSTCPYCQAQSPVLKSIVMEQSLASWAVSLDGLAMPDGLWPEWSHNPEAATLFNIQRVPAIGIVTRGGHFQTIAQGLQSEYEIEALLRAVNLWLNAQNPIREPQP